MKQKSGLTSVFWALMFAITFAGSVYILSSQDISVSITALTIVINVIVFGIYTLKFIQSIRLLDEVQIRIQLEAVTIAFALSLLTVMVLGLAGLVENLGLNNISYLYIFPLFFAWYFLGFLISKYRYR